MLELTHPNGEQFDVSQGGWDAVLGLAAEHGWKQPEHIELGLSRQEAQALADAVQRGLVHFLLHPPREQSRAPDWEADVDDEQAARNLLPHVFTPRSEPFWRKFIAFCRAGGFRIRIVEHRPTF